MFRGTVEKTKCGMAEVEQERLHKGESRGAEGREKSEERVRDQKLRREGRRKREI